MSYSHTYFFFGSPAKPAQANFNTTRLLVST
jgi:hypothetical protein